MRSKTDANLRDSGAMADLFFRSPTQPLKLTIRQDRIRDIKRGYPWVFAHSLVNPPDASPGSFAVLRDRDNTIIAKGMYDPSCPIVFRVCALEEPLSSELIETRIRQALARRGTILSNETDCCRLLNGEGDGLPGVICDRYADTAVLQLDGTGPSAFWNIEEFARIIRSTAGIQKVYLKPRSGSEQPSRALCGELPAAPIVVREHGALFEVDLIDGQKSGFFLDQRENRLLIRSMAAGKKVLNLFGYTGGFSIAAGLGGAQHVTTVDIARPAVLGAERNWELNGLPAASHQACAENAFDFIDRAAEEGSRFDLIVADPPSFVPSRAAVEKGENAYITLFARCIPLLAPGGILAAASCSSHVSTEQFMQICTEAFSRARRRATVLGVHGQPADHPFPLACREQQYLKFVLLQAERQ